MLQITLQFVINGEGGASSRYWWEKSWKFDKRVVQISGGGVIELEKNI